MIYIVSAPPLVTGDLWPMTAQGLVYHGRGVRSLDVAVRAGVPPIIIDRLRRPEFNRFSVMLESEFIIL